MHRPPGAQAVTLSQTKSGFPTLREKAPWDPCGYTDNHRLSSPSQTGSGWVIEELTNSGSSCGPEGGRLVPKLPRLPLTKAEPGQQEITRLEDFLAGRSDGKGWVGVHACVHMVDGASES